MHEINDKACATYLMKILFSVSIRFNIRDRLLFYIMRNEISLTIIQHSFFENLRSMSALALFLSLAFHTTNEYISSLTPVPYSIYTLSNNTTRSKPDKKLKLISFEYLMRPMDIDSSGLLRTKEKGANESATFQFLQISIRFNLPEMLFFFGVLTSLLFK